MSIHKLIDKKICNQWSLIPLIPGGKKPVVPWKRFQSQRASEAQVEAWFSNTDLNIGVVTGRISELVVLDIDKRSIFRKLTAEIPPLYQSFIVETRRGYHVYLHLPPHLTFPSMSFDGLDILSDGRYVVAASSTVSGFTYRVQIRRKPITLTPDLMAAIIDFAGTNTKHSPTPVKEPPEAEIAHPDIKPSALQYMYRSRAGREGRNNALFEIACYGRDHGLSQFVVESALVDIHTYQESPYTLRESLVARRREAERTIRSAFNRPARPHRNRVGQSSDSQLPNTIVEHLLNDNRAYVVRTLVAVRLKGIKPGMPFEASQAKKLLKGVVGRDSIDAALQFLETVSPEPPSKMSKDVAIEQAKSLNNNCVMFRVKKSGISRTTRLFFMPTDAQLAALLGCKDGPVLDHFTLEDIKSAKKLRQSYHVRFIRRRSGQYHNALLAKRLGVCKRTVQNYNAADKNIQSAPQYQENRVFWSNIEKLIPDELPHGGFFLTDKWGKRYPAKREAARFLLTQKGNRVTLYRQIANMYWYGDLPMPSLSLPAPEQVPTFQRQHYPVASAPMPTARKPSARTHAESHRPSFRPQYDLPADDPEAIKRFAQHLYEQINTLPTEEGGKLSLKRAEGMVERYGIANVRTALQRTLKRKNVYKPAGFLVTILRSEHKWLGKS